MMRCAIVLLVFTVPVVAEEGLVGEDLGLGLTSAWGSSANHQFSLLFRFGDVISPELADIAIADTGSFFAKVGYKHYFRTTSVKVPDEYRSEPTFSLNTGFGSWEIVVLIPFEYNVFKAGTGFSIPMGKQALVEVDFAYTNVEDFSISDIYYIRSGIAFLPTGDFYLRLGWLYDRYETSGASGNHGSILASAGYLWGDTDNGLDVSFNYRARHENNGGDSESDYITFGLDWYLTSKLTLGAGYEDVSGDLDSEGNVIEVRFALRPTREFQLGFGYRNHYLASPDERYNNFCVRMSYDF